jgi:hypothetical protein
MKKTVIVVVLAGILGFVLIQFIPFGRDHTNPPSASEPQWSSAQARSLVKEQCFQCHSNETTWPWYSNIAPASWLVAADVIGARSKFNFSDWNTYPGELNEMVGAIQEGEMPPIQYSAFHPNSRLNAQQKADLIGALHSSIK